MSASRFRIELAGSDDDARLRARMAAECMEGDVAVSFRREPDFFAGCRVQGDATQVVKCTDGANGELIGLGSRSTVFAHVDGEPRRIGYLSDLRLAAKHRSSALLARGYRMLRRLHADDPVPFYTTVIYEGNAPALSALLGGRAGLPLYVDWGRVLTPALPLGFPVKQAPVARVSLEKGSPSRLGDIVAFLNREAAGKQFSPVYREKDFPAGRFLGLRASDFFLAIRGGEIVGTLAAWDQTEFRQTHIERYPVRLALLRPLYNALAALTPLKPLPGGGAPIPYLYLACLATEHNNVDLFRFLLRVALEALRRGPWSFAIAGLHEADPLAAALGELRALRAAGRLFAVHYPEEPLAAEPPARRVPYLEAGCL